MRKRAQIRQVEACLEVQREVGSRVRQGVPADAALAEIFRGARHYGSRDRRFFSAAIFAEFRWRGWVRRIGDSRLQLAVALALDGQRDYARALAEHPALEADPPAALREKSAWIRRAFPEAAPAHIDELVPEWTFDAIPSDGAPAFVERYVESIQQRPPLWLRARHGEAESVCEQLRAAGFDCSADPRLPGAVRVEGWPGSGVLTPLLHRSAEIQDWASQRVGRLCAARAGEHWWDVCAGAGGKSLHLLEQLKGTGSVLCTDIRPRVLEELKRRASAAGYRNWTARLLEDEVFEDVRFDGILIDAPCSGTGTWNRNPDARWRTAREDLTRYRDQQIALLQRALPRLKSGGRLIYAVCSLTRTETNDVLTALLNATPIAVESTLRIDPASGPCIGMWAAEIKTK